MLDEKKIEEAAEKYGADNDCLVIGRDGRMSLKPELENAFEQGAHWAIKEFLKGLWHDASKEPKKGKMLFLHRKVGYTRFMIERLNDSYDWNVLIYAFDICEWLYIEDLLPKQKGGEG